MNFKIKREFVIGLTFAAGLFVLIWGLNFMKGHMFFNNDRKLYAIYNQVDGLVVSNPVNINGLKVGKVEKISFLNDNSGKLIVEFSVKNDFQIPANSIAQIYSSDIMGSKAIGIKLGDAKELAQNRDTLKSSIQGTLQEAVNVQLMPLKAKTENLISSLDSVMTVIQYVFNEKTREHLAKSFENISLAIDNIKHTTSSLDNLMTSESNRLVTIFSNIESITSTFRSNNAQLGNIIRNFSLISDSIAKSDIARVIESTNKTMTEASSIMTKINKGEGTVGLLINNDSLYNALTATSLELKALTEDLKLNPHRYVHISVFGRNPKKNEYKAPAKKE